MQSKIDQMTKQQKMKQDSLPMILQKVSLQVNEKIDERTP